MSLIVQKFGGSSVRDAQRVLNVARRVATVFDQGNKVVVVVSAQGDTTDDLIAKAMEINPKANKREMDVLLSSGEQISIALLAMALESMGYPAKSLTGWQAGFVTDSTHGNSRIRRVETERIENELDKGNIVIVAGFQGLNRYDDITTLGRGGSDTSAVAIAAACRADLCQIYTDVDGVYTADPRLVSGTRKLSEITYDEMLELASLGAQVLHNRSVEMAKKYNVPLEVLSSLEEKPGTVIKEVAKVEKMLIKGVAKDDEVTRISIIGVQDIPGIAFQIFSALAAKKVNVDIILQSVGRNETKDITFTVAGLKGTLRAKGISCEGVTKVSVVGAGMESNYGVAAKMFEALSEASINIQMIATSEIKISVLIDREDGLRAMRVVHEAFFAT